MGFDSSETGRNGLSTVFALVLRRPSLWIEAMRAWLAMRARGGLRPASSYLEWRYFTAYGDHLTTTSAHDVVKYLEWRRGMRRIRRWERVA